MIFSNDSTVLCLMYGFLTDICSRNTFVPPTSYTNPDIVCHLNATPAGSEAPVNAGDVIEIQWNTWPASHKGPVIDYLANCNGPCVSPTQEKPAGGETWVTNICDV
jgi:hypothetical protein